MFLEPKKREHCRKLCEKRYYYEKLFRGVETDVDRCVKLCIQLAK